MTAHSLEFTGKFGIGQPVRRVEDHRFISGAGRFVDDIDLPRQCYGVVVLSPHAHARIKSIDVTQAQAAPGVLCVLTGADAEADGIGTIPPVMPEDMGGPKGYRTQWPLLVSDKVRAIGERIAFVVAETLGQARDAAELVEADYEMLPAVTVPEEAVKDGAPTVWEECPGNVSFTLMFGNKEATDAAFAKAKHVVTLRLENNRVFPAAMEPRAAIGDYRVADDAYTLYTTSQNPHGNRSVLAGAVLRVPEIKLRVISPDVGGGFGMKFGAYPEDALVLWGSKRCGRPVKWTSTRSESFLSDSHGRDQVVHGDMALDADGKILGMRMHGLNDMGSHIVGAAIVVPLFSSRLAPGVYDIPAAHIVSQAVFTTTTPLAPYRGAGRPEATYLVERLIDRAAAQTGIDPAEIRRRNYIAPANMPYKTATGTTYDSGDFARVMDECLTLADWSGFAERAAESKQGGKLRGRGFAYFIEEASVFNDRMDIRFDPSGMVTILAGTHSHGQGHATAFAQLVSEWLGIPFQSIRYVQGDTDAVPMGRGTYGSRSSMVGGNALKKAADAIIEKAKAMAAHLMEAAAEDIEFKDGKFSIAGTDRSMSITDTAKAFYRPMFLPPQFGVGLEASGTFASEPPNYPNGCHTCEVEIDPDNGKVEVVRYTAVDDVGMVLNHLLVEGQIHGGVAQGLGQALMETVAFDSSGQLVSGSFQDYAMPRALNMPHMTSDIVEVPATTNPLGIKGCGEAGATGAPPAIMNAILDALRPLGIDHIDMPATPPRVWQAIQGAKANGQHGHR
jgi:carbon-monoxide dehydrogenase large subunit